MTEAESKVWERIQSLILFAYDGKQYGPLLKVEKAVASVVCREPTSNYGSSRSRA